MIVVFDDADVLVQSEDAACQQERLGDVVEQPARHVVDVDDLIGHHGDAAHDEQHRTGVLRDLKACVFHSVRLSCIFKVLINRVNCVCFMVLDYLLNTLQRYEKFLNYPNF